MAASHHHLAQHPQAPPHNRAPRAGHPDLELFPFLSDTFIDSLTARQAHQWAVLVMPDTVASTIRKNCSVREKRSTLKFLRDLKRGDPIAAQAEPFDYRQPPAPQQMAPQNQQRAGHGNNDLMNTANVHNGNNTGDIQAQIGAAVPQGQADQQANDWEQRFDRSYEDFGQRYPSHNGYIAPDRRNYFGNADIDPRRSFSGAPPPAGAGAGAANGPSDAPGFRGRDRERAVYSRVGQPQERDLEHRSVTFAREAGEAAREYDDRNFQPASRGYF